MIGIPDPTDCSALEIVVSIAPPKVQRVFKSGGNAKIAPAPRWQQGAQGSRASNPSLVNAGAGSMQGTRPYARSVTHQGNPTGHTTSSARGSNADTGSTQDIHPYVRSVPQQGSPTGPTGHTGHTTRSAKGSMPRPANVTGGQGSVAQEGVALSHFSGRLPVNPTPTAGQYTAHFYLIFFVSKWPATTIAI